MDVLDTDLETDVRLVVSDMDGTLLDGNGAIPPGFWPLYEKMRDKGIPFVPASGRQYATLARSFEHLGEELSFIAENGGLVVHDGEVVSATGLDPDVVAELVRTVRRRSSEYNFGVVVCGRRSAYVERSDAAFVEKVETYYAALEIVADLTVVDDEILKVAVLDFDGAERSAELFAPFRETHKVVTSARQWIDIMDPNVNKGNAVRLLQDELGVTAAQTVAFGDYLNDFEMLGAVDLSFAMANAHPTIREHARYAAPSNEEHGVVTVLDRLLGN